MEQEQIAEKNHPSIKCRSLKRLGSVSPQNLLVPSVGGGAWREVLGSRGGFSSMA